MSSCSQLVTAIVLGMTLTPPQALNGDKIDPSSRPDKAEDERVRSFILFIFYCLKSAILR